MIALLLSPGAIILLLFLLVVLSSSIYNFERKKIEESNLINNSTVLKSTPIQRIHRLTAFILVLAIVFYLFFQVNKHNPFAMGNPFAVDPYDAVGSIAIQLALLISLLSYARVLRCREDPNQLKERLILHGNILVLAAIFITLCSDTVAEFVRRLPHSVWVTILRLELGGMFLLTLFCGLALWLVFRGVPTAPPPANLTPADAIDDLWSLVRLPVIRAGAIFPPPVVEWVKRFNSDRLFAHFQWLDPRRHPRRFTAAVGLLIGLALWLAGFQEGLPPSLGIGLLLLGIDISVELVATMLGFAILGGYLGIRPSFRKLM